MRVRALWALQAQLHPQPSTASCSGFLLDGEGAESQLVVLLGTRDSVPCGVLWHQGIGKHSYEVRGGRFPSRPTHHQAAPSFDTTCTLRTLSTDPRPRPPFRFRAHAPASRRTSRPSERWTGTGVRQPNPPPRSESHHQRNDVCYESGTPGWGSTRSALSLALFFPFQAVFKPSQFYLLNFNFFLLETCMD